MKKVIGLVGNWLMSSKGAKTIVDGVEVVGKNKLNKMKLTAVIIVVLGLLLLTGAISEETFILLFDEVN
jgi:hypothetical protein|tara:strand:- start:479 stop:685 length:207 start_codon:yes stop_codon:yes gene_type:complete